MPLTNLLYVDDDSTWRGLCQRRFQRELTPNVDVAEDYASALQKIKKTRYDLIVLDSLEGDCFRVHKDINDVPHGDVVIFSGNFQIQAEAKKLGIPFYNKPQDLDKIVATYKK